MYVPFCRCESFPYISRRADWFHCALFPCHSPCTPLVFISVPVMSLSVPLCFPFISRCFPDMWTSYFLPSFPCTSLHFPFAFQYFPQNKTLFFQRFRKEDVQKHRVFLDFSLHFLAFPLGSPVFPAAFSQRGHPKTQSFSRFSAKASRKPKPAKSRQGESSLGPLFCDTGSPKVIKSPRIRRRAGGGGGLGGGLSSILSRCPTRRAMSADLTGGSFGLFQLRNRQAEPLFAGSYRRRRWVPRTSRWASFGLKQRRKSTQTQMHVYFYIYKQV